jgi:hypothetical protein
VPATPAGPAGTVTRVSDWRKKKLAKPGLHATALSIFTSGIYI